MRKSQTIFMKKCTRILDASGGIVTCEAPERGANVFVSDHVCVECPAGKTSNGYHDASRGNIVCEAAERDAKENVAGHVGVECAA